MSDQTIIFAIDEPPQPARHTHLHCLPNQRLKMGDEVVVTIGGQEVLWGTVETRFPNIPRRLTIRYTAVNGTTGITRAYGTLPGPAENVGTQHEIKVLRVMSRSRAL